MATGLFLTDSPATGQPIYDLWANRYTVGDGGEYVIYTVGPRLYKGYKAGVDGTRQATAAVVTGAGDAVKFFERTGDDAKQVFTVFVFLGDDFIDEIFDELGNMADALANGTFDDYVSGKLYSAGQKFLSAASAVYNYFF